MKERKYDSNWFKKIYEIKETGNLEKALKFINQYIKKYPNDEYAKTFYINLLISCNRLDEALEEIQNVCDLDYNRSHQLYRIAFLKNDFEEAYRLLPIAHQKFLDLNEETEHYILEKIFLENRLGYNFEQNKSGYLVQQIVSYDEQRAIEHIERHKDIEKVEIIEDLFEEEIDIKNLFYLVKKSLENAEPYTKDTFSCKYYFNYPNISNIVFNNGNLYKYLCVAAFRDTNEIITIYPIQSKEKIHNVNYLRQEEKKVKRKTLTQIEKFNKKYNKEK